MRCIKTWLVALLPLALCAFPPDLLAQRDNRVLEGVKLFEAGRHAEARPVLEEAHRAAPDDHRAAFYLGRIAYATQEWGKASDWFEKAMKLDENNALYHLWLGRSYGAEAQRANTLRQAVLARRVKGAFERSVALDPSNPEAHFDLMSFYLAAPGVMGGSQEKARVAAEEVRKLSAWLGFQAWAQIYRHEQDAAGVERELRTGIQTFPDSALPYLSLGSHYQQHSQFGQAFEIYEALIARRPAKQDSAYRSALYQVGRAAAVSGERLEQGEKALRGYLESTEPNDPLRVGAHWRLGMILEHQGKIDLARQQYEAALAIDPKHKESKEALKKLR